MSSEELWEIFHDELPDDLETLSGFIENNDYSALKAFAHKYKVRLAYLGFNDAHEYCLAMESSFTAADYSTLMERAGYLLTCLRSIG